MQQYYVLLYNGDKMLGVYNKCGLLADLKTWRYNFEMWKSNICICGFHKNLHLLWDSSCVFGKCKLFVPKFYNENTKLR